MRQRVLADLCKTMQGINWQAKPSWGFTYPFEITVNAFSIFLYFFMFGKVAVSRPLKIPFAG